MRGTILEQIGELEDSLKDFRDDLQSLKHHLESNQDLKEFKESLKKKQELIIKQCEALEKKNFEKYISKDVLINLKNLVSSDKLTELLSFDGGDEKKKDLLMKTLDEILDDSNSNIESLVPHVLKPKSNSYFLRMVAYIKMAIVMVIPLLFFCSLFITTDDFLNKK